MFAGSRLAHEPEQKAAAVGAAAPAVVADELRALARAARLQRHWLAGERPNLGDAVELPVSELLALLAAAPAPRTGRSASPQKAPGAVTGIGARWPACTPRSPGREVA